jgi:hypothetical protein
MGFDPITAWDYVGTSAGFASVGGAGTIAYKTSEKRWVSEYGTLDCRRGYMS